MSHLEDIKQYARSCLADEIPSGQKHKWACQRFLDDLDRVGTTDFPYIWSEDSANKIVAWFALLRHSKGALAGKPIELNDWQKFRTCQLYGWVHRETGKKRFKKSFTEVGRKNGKSQSESGEALYEIAIQSTKNMETYEVYTAGTKREQSKIVFNECNLMTKGSILRSKFNFKRDEIVHIKTGSFIKPLSKEDGKTGDGTNPACLILDRDLSSINRGVSVKAKGKSLC